MLVKNLLATVRNDVVFVENVFPFKEKKPHFTVLHWNLFTSSFEMKNARTEVHFQLVSMMSTIFFLSLTLTESATESADVSEHQTQHVFSSLP
jgi:hypothetical protein